ncbi:L-serine ammonia-lyase, iron-sulfur-dependent, subunit alpha [Thermosyntropha sp.]|uniref:L-serine ammonia-lyase, iron-sulfur-dependent, subunit alpha n=1 Tax=Thermosyntropha sp. TaxID=2740820 RepID=UPI0025FC15D5|nr:L-serine ammonia-lyase, iron-sulfur-dependent, subunit alpha [Thermosyntropha sp.]MBO8158231.1 L-serine ammonia-lyase, iron-sulfur-dependent, subunit alpha [Thermosyntropha sp.]
MYQFNHAVELLNLCREYKLSIPEITLRAEAEESGRNVEEIWRLTEENFRVMEESIRKGLNPDIRSVGGLIGGNAYKLSIYGQADTLSGRKIVKAASYALAVSEVNAAMGKIVAAPTAGSSGVVPGVIISIKEEKNLKLKDAIEGLLVAAAVGKIIAVNATLSGAEGGCQAEIGSAAAMAAAAAVFMSGGKEQMCFDAASIALKGLLGLVCDPVAGLVEVPCSKRNAVAAAVALISADMTLAGISSFIPFDEVVEAMSRVGRQMSPDLRETARGGCAITPTALAFTRHIIEQSDDL